MINRNVFLSLSIFVVAMTFLGGCFDEEFIPSDIAEIEFSLDTLRFDTVFTTIGSATREIKIYNRSDNAVTIESIGIPSMSKFRLNIDGYSSNAQNNINIAANDSLYVFVEVTVDPDAPLSESPFVINDLLEVRSLSGSKTVLLEAWGQNANYFPSKDSKGRLIRLTCNNETVVWDDPKPYVVYGLLFIDSCGLVIAPGTEVFVHGGLALLDNQIFNDGGLIFMADGYLDVVGRTDEPVVFQGDRLEEGFNDVNGQWAGIRFLSNSRDNQITNAIIKNSIVGLRVDSAAQLNISSSIIANTSNVGLIGINAQIEGDNCLIHSNGAQSLLLTSGGDYIFDYMTIANYGNNQPALFIDNYDCLDEDCVDTATRPLSLTMTNCIVSGSNPDELVMTDITQGEEVESFKVLFNNTLIVVDETKQEFDLTQFCNSCIELVDQPLFRGEDLNDYRLDSASAALGVGIYIESLRRDILGIDRDAVTPDIGCYESQE